MLLKKRLLVANQWQKILSNSNLKGIIYIQNGTMDEIIKVARINKVKTIELQHSILSSLNTLYNYKSQNKNIYLNDYLLLWGDAWSKYSNKQVTNITIGSVNKFLDFHNNTKKKKTKNILIIGSVKGRKQLSNIALKLSEKLKDYKIYYKLRPEEYKYWKQVFPKNFKASKNLTIIDNEKYTLEHYINKCSYVAGIESTVLFEAMFQGQTPLFIKDKMGWHKEYKDFYNSGIGHVVGGSKDIISLLTNDDQITNFNTNDFIKKFNKERFLEFFHSIS